MPDPDPQLGVMQEIRECVTGMSACMLRMETEISELKKEIKRGNDHEEYARKLDQKKKDNKATQQGSVYQRGKRGKKKGS